MYESVISHPPKDWEVIPSIDVRVGERLKEEYPDPSKRPVINIDVEAAKTALKFLENDDSKPGLVALNVVPALAEKRSYPQKRAGYAEAAGYGSLAVVALGSTMSEVYTSEFHQECVVHELKHCADFTSKSSRKTQRKYNQSLEAHKLRLGAIWEGILDSFMDGLHPIGHIYGFPIAGQGLISQREDSASARLYFGSPLEKAGYATADEAQKLPRIISFDKPKKKK